MLGNVSNLVTFIQNKKPLQYFHIVTIDNTHKYTTQVGFSINSRDYYKNRKSTLHKLELLTSVSGHLLTWPYNIKYKTIN